MFILQQWPPDLRRSDGELDSVDLRVQLFVAQVCVDDRGDRIGVVGEPLGEEEILPPSTIRGVAMLAFGARSLSSNSPLDRPGYQPKSIPTPFSRYRLAGSTRNR